MTMKKNVRNIKNLMENYFKDNTVTEEMFT